MRISTATLGRARELAAERLGLSFPRERDADLERALQDALQASRMRSADEYLDALAAGTDGDPDWLGLSAHLTVGETYFWRDLPFVGELEREVIPAIIQARRGTRHLRIWSAGCATGEEPYTLAILLDRLLPGRRAWNITLLATDLSARSIAAARRGHYRAWSLRDVPAAVREGYFEPRGAGRFELAPRIREMVRFERFNLARGVPAEIAGAPVDLLLCRNVLMYFTPVAAREVAARLRDALAKDGWLAVSAVEAWSELFRPLRPNNLPGGIFFRWDAAGGKAARPAPARPSTRRSPERARRAAQTGAPNVVPAGPVVTGGLVDLKARAQSLADRGALAEARQVCQAVIAADRLDAEACRLLASIEQECGDAPAALDLLRRALYLDPDSFDAHLAYGNLLARHGQRRRGLRHLQVAEKLRRMRGEAS
jgi:chemotaxis protein methyltransferase CheR